MGSVGNAPRPPGVVESPGLREGACLTPELGLWSKVARQTQVKFEFQRTNNFLDIPILKYFLLSSELYPVFLPQVWQPYLRPVM